MKVLSSSLRVTLAACALSTLASVTSATVLYTENFNTPDSSTPLSSFGWTAFNGGSPSNATINSSGTTTGEIFNTQRAAFVNLNTTSATTLWFGGMRYTYASALPPSAQSDLSQLSLTANVYAGGSVGNRGDAILRIESSANNWIGFSISGTTLTTNNGLLAGGLLSAPTATAGTFNPSATSFNIVIAYANTLSTWGNDSSNILGIDNVSFTQIPEPSAAAALVGALALGTVATRRRRR